MSPLSILFTGPAYAPPYLLTSHDPIYIYGNDNFIPANGVVGGSGTAGDPYIIEGWDIIAENANGIEIRNTDVYFIIRDCYVHDGRAAQEFGIYLSGVKNGKIYSNILKNNEHGIGLSDSSSNFVSKNTVEKNLNGIYLFVSVSNLISNNIVENNDGGIDLYFSSTNFISNNACMNNEYGIRLFDSSNNILSSNACESNAVDGICLSTSSNNTLSNNACESNYYGIRLSGSSNNLVSNNNVEINTHGISLGHSDNNMISNNIVEKNDYGVYLCCESDNNIIYHNNFITNPTQADDECFNYWDNGYPSGGNYWSDYTGVDENQGENQDISGSDGIGDVPYNISGNANQDRYPLMKQFGEVPTRNWPLIAGIVGMIAIIGIVLMFYISTLKKIKIKLKRIRPRERRRGRPRRRKKRKMPWEAALAIGLIATVVSVAAMALLLTQPQERIPIEASITGLTIDNIDCKVKSCIVKSGASMVVSVGIQSSRTIENVEVHVFGVWSQRQSKYQVDESRFVRLEAGENRTESFETTENFETTAYCSPCAGINPGPYGMYAEISIWRFTETSADKEVLDNYETTIYLIE